MMNLAQELTSTKLKSLSELTHAELVRGTNTGSSDQDGSLYKPDQDGWQRAAAMLVTAHPYQCIKNSGTKHKHV